MSLTKRKATQTLGRRVRARRETSEELDFTSPEPESTDVKPHHHQSDPEEGIEEEDEEDEDEDENEDDDEV